MAHREVATLSDNTSHDKYCGISVFRETSVDCLSEITRADLIDCFDCAEVIGGSAPALRLDETDFRIVFLFVEIVDCSIDLKLDIISAIAGF